ncbi:MAG: hypothetical protein AAFU70_07520 [Planctomycetota bacterium]
MNAPDLTLFPIPAAPPNLTPKAHHRAPRGTSEVAAKLIADHALTQRDRILTLIRASGAEGVTDDEGEAELGIKSQSYTPRRGELVAMGFIVDSRRRRLSVSGRPAAVWVTPNHAPPRDEPDGGAA